MSKSAWTCHMFSPYNILGQVLSFQPLSSFYGHPTNRKKNFFGKDWYASKCLTIGPIGENSSGL